MDYRPRDVRELILERVFPDLRYGGDLDIERYFDLRASSRMLDALAIYKTRLRPRYPDDAKRVILLKLYRTRSPVFAEFLHGLLMDRANEIIARLRNNIDAIVAPLAGVSMQNTYAVLKAVERVARLLPDDADDARRMAWDHADYAKLLNHRTTEADRAAYLLSEFYDQAAVDDDVPTDFVAASLASEVSRRQREREAEKKNFFDLSKIEFDESDVRRIEIPAGLERDEDVVLAYCHKYWLRVDDPAFERIVWLYSRKYGTRHHDVFKAVKTGRHKKYQDDDILTMVATTIATRYSYTVQGDIYMQAAWRRIKANLYGQLSIQQTLERATAAAAAEPRQSKPVKTRTRVAPVTVRALEPGQPRVHSGSSMTSTGNHATKPRLMRAPTIRPLHREETRKPSVPEIKATGSISDKIKRLSGRAYDVYKDIFLSSVRGQIRTSLLRNRTKFAGVFNDDTNKAENFIYDFMERNYSNAYMDWPSSEHRARIKEIGFDLESLDGIIEACYRKIDA